VQFALHRWYSHQLFCASSNRAVSFYVLSKVCCPLPTDTCRTWLASPASLQNDICARCQKKCQGEHQFASPKSNKNNLPKPPKHQTFLSREGTRKSSHLFSRSIYWNPWWLGDPPFEPFHSPPPRLLGISPRRVQSQASERSQPPRLDDLRTERTEDIYDS
jgi:hypothetical protein